VSKVIKAVDKKWFFVEICSKRMVFPALKKFTNAALGLWSFLAKTKIDLVKWLSRLLVTFA
jgi:hypothetical protein